MILNDADYERSQHLLSQSKRGGCCASVTLPSESPEALLGNGAAGEFFGDSHISSNASQAQTYGAQAYTPCILLGQA